MIKLKKALSAVLCLTLVAGGMTFTGTRDAAADGSVVRYEAENADRFVQGSADGEHNIQQSDNYSGGYAVGDMNTWPENGRAYCETDVYIEEAGTYQITVGYAGGEANHPCTIDVRVNDGEWISMVADPTSSWDVVSTVSSRIELEEGLNTIDVTGACNIWYSDMGWEWINLDYFELEKMEEAAMMMNAGDMVDAGQIRMVGRTLLEGTSMTMDYTTSGFQFVYTGLGSIMASFTADTASGLVVDVDGVETSVTVPSGTTEVTIVRDLEYGTHTIKVYKVTEAAGYLMRLNSISCYDESAQFVATDESDLRFEFVGDSITCGNQIDSNTGDENGYYAYASVLSRAYNADWNTISCSGRGLMEGWNSEDGWAASQDGQLKDIFGYVSWFRDKETKYDYSYQPDVLVMSVGSNDLGDEIMSTFGTSIEDFCDEVEAVSKDFREHYPDTYIIWCYGTYLNNDYADEYSKAVYSLGDDNMDFVLFPQMTGGKDGHPNYTQHTRMAKILSEVISEKLGVENPMGKDMHYELEDGVITAAGSSATVTTIEGWTSVYSGNSYVEGANVNVSDPNDAAYVTIPVKVDEAGSYAVTVSYGSTDKAPLIAVKANDDDWSTYTGGYGTDWNAIQTIDAIVYLNEGENTISVTGAINGAWASLDCIDLTYITSKRISSGGADDEQSGQDADASASDDATSTSNGAVNANASNNSSSLSNVSKAVAKPAKAVIQKVSAKKASSKKLTVKMKKISGANGYSVSVYKTKKNAKKNKKAIVTKTSKKAKVTITSKKLKNKKKLFVRTRAYVNDDGKKVYGAWSKVKKVKIK